MPKNNARILFLDVETFPNVAYVWGKYQQDVIRYKQETCLATYAAKWLGEGQVFARSLPEYKRYRPNSYDDRALVRDLWALLDEADVVVAHNGKSFDVKVCKARFIYHALPPPSPFKIVDTKDAVKRVARFNSNKLDDLGSLLGMGKKIKTDFDLWEGCIQGDPKSWSQMVEYNKKDVILLEKLYLRILPWISNHPNLTVYDGRAKCPKCGSGRTRQRGTQRSMTGEYQRFQCLDCGGWLQSTKRDRGTGVKNAE